ncbi:MAG: lysine--tRNA ligase, partial [Pirellulales bacterium]|nr:lysine--tRNA ligase [Pirellulales bacterium]
MARWNLALADGVIGIPLNETPQVDCMDPLETARRQKLRRIVEMGHDPWGSRFDNHLPIGTIRGRAGEIVYQRADGGQVDLPDFDQVADDFDFRGWLADQGQGQLIGPHVRAAGRIVRQRDAGKLIFVDIRDWTGQIQLFIGKKQVGDDWELAQCFDLGDIIGVDGSLIRTKMGELSIFAERLFFLSKSIETPPDKHAGLADIELRQRMRYVDLVHTVGAMDRFLRRTKIIASVRNTLARLGFVEIEGPTLHAIAGGAAARPFVTHHNALDLDLYLRIALELHLKRLLVGGVERVYELGRVYRNEGISPKHNPEFTMLEVYQAYGDYRSMMDLTEQCIVDAIDAIGGSRRLPYGDSVIDFEPPFTRKTYDELFMEHTGIDPRDTDAVSELARQMGIDTVNRHPDVIKNDVFEAR